MAIQLPPHNLAMLDRCLAETDPTCTDVVVMTANVLPLASADKQPTITEEDRALLTAVVNMAEHAGKPVRPLIVPTNEPFHAITRTAKAIGAQEIFMGASNRYAADDQIDQVALYWLHLCKAHPEPLTIRVLSNDRDVKLDIGGGSQIPGPGAREEEAQRILADLRSSWRGVERLLLAYDGSPLSADFLDTVLSFLDPAVAVTLIDVAEEVPRDHDGDGVPEAARARSSPRWGSARAPQELGRAFGRHRTDRRGRPGPGDRQGGDGGELRRDLHEPPRRVPQARHPAHGPDDQLRPGPRPLPRHPRLPAQVDPPRGRAGRGAGRRAEPV